MRRQPTDFLRARLVTLYLLSLAAVYGSLLAWRPEQSSSLLSLAWPPAVLGAAALAGAAIHHKLSEMFERTIRSRLRGVGGVLYGGVLFFVVLGLLAGQREAVDSGGAALRALQPLFLLLAGLGRGYLGTILNAFALTATSMLAGGAGAAVSASLHGGLVAFFLTADHAARKLTEYPVDHQPRPGPILARGGAHAVSISAVLASWFWFFPAAAYAPLQRTGAGASIPPDRLAGLMANLLYVAVASSLAFYLMLRFSGGPRSSDGESLPVPPVSARRRSQAAVGAPLPASLPPPKEWSARIVQLYVRTTDQLARWGRRRQPHQTAQEFARTLAPAGAAVELAGLFSRARYSHETMSREDFETASRASLEILEHHRRRQS